MSSPMEDEYKLKGSPLSDLIRSGTLFFDLILPWIQKLSRVQLLVTCKFLHALSQHNSLLYWKQIPWMIDHRKEQLYQNSNIFPYTKRMDLDLTKESYFISSSVEARISVLKNKVTTLFIGGTSNEEKKFNDFIHRKPQTIEIKQNLFILFTNITHLHLNGDSIIYICSFFNEMKPIFPKCIHLYVRNYSHMSTNRPVDDQCQIDRIFPVLDLFHLHYKSLTLLPETFEKLNPYTTICQLLDHAKKLELSCVYNLQRLLITYKPFLKKVIFLSGRFISMDNEEKINEELIFPWILEKYIIQIQDQYPCAFKIVTTMQQPLIEKCIWKASTPLRHLHLENSSHVPQKYLSFHYFKLDYLQQIVSLQCKTREFDTIHSLEMFHSLRFVTLEGSWNRIFTLLQTLPTRVKETQLETISITIDTLSLAPLKASYKEYKMDLDGFLCFKKLGNIQIILKRQETLISIVDNTKLATSEKDQSDMRNHILFHLFLCIATSHHLTFLSFVSMDIHEFHSNISCDRYALPQLWNLQMPQQQFYECFKTHIYDILPISLTHCKILPIQLLYYNLDIHVYNRQHPFMFISENNLLKERTCLHSTPPRSYNMKFENEAILTFGYGKNLHFPTKTTNVLMSLLFNKCKKLSRLHLLSETDLTNYESKESNTDTCIHHKIKKPFISLTAPELQLKYMAELKCNHACYMESGKMSSPFMSLF